MFSITRKLGVSLQVATCNHLVYTNDDSKTSRRRQKLCGWRVCTSTPGTLGLFGMARLELDLWCICRLKAEHWIHNGRLAVSTLICCILAAAPSRSATEAQLTEPLTPFVDGMLPTNSCLIYVAPNRLNICALLPVLFLNRRLTNSRPIVRYNIR